MAWARPKYDAQATKRAALIFAASRTPRRVVGLGDSVKGEAPGQFEVVRCK